MNVIVEGLDGLKMSSSKPPETKIEFLDDPETVRTKVFKATCEDGITSPNGLLGILRDVLIPISELRVERLQGATALNLGEGNSALGDQNPFISSDAPRGTLFSFSDESIRGTTQHYSSFSDIEHAFAQRKLSSNMLKSSITSALNQLLAPIREIYAASDEWQRIDRLAYPDAIVLGK